MVRKGQERLCRGAPLLWVLRVQRRVFWMAAAMRCWCCHASFPTVCGVAVISLHQTAPAIRVGCLLRWLCSYMCRSSVRGASVYFTVVGAMFESALSLRDFNFAASCFLLCAVGRWLSPHRSITHHRSSCPQPCTRHSAWPWSKRADARSSPSHQTDSRTQRSSAHSARRVLLTYCTRGRSRVVARK
jgi:hypothetical protein